MKFEFLIKLLVTVCISTGVIANELGEMKTINYRDAVEFEIPTSWKFEDEKGVEGTSYEDLHDSGTLRVSVYEWPSESEQERNEKLQRALLPGNIETLAQGVYLKTEITEGSEGTEKFSLYRWVVALALPENLFRLIIFTHTIVDGQEAEPKVSNELEIVNNSVRNAKFSYRTDLELVDRF